MDMPVLAIFTGKGFTKAMYEALRKEVKWESRHPEGAIFHSCAFDDQGHLRVADVWDSPEKMSAFVDNRLAPAMKKLGVPPPSVEVYPAHNTNVYPSAERFRLK
jgi:hypothetical protein